MVVVAAAVYPHLLYIFVFGLLFLFAVAAYIPHLLNLLNDTAVIVGGDRISLLRL